MAEWSYRSLREHWADDDMMVRSGLPMDRMGSTLAAVYDRRLTLDQATQLTALPEPESSTTEPNSPLLLEPGQSY